MKARAFFDAFTTHVECVGYARDTPAVRDAYRSAACDKISGRHGEKAGVEAELMFDRMWNDAQKPLAR